MKKDNIIPLIFLLISLSCGVFIFVHNERNKASADVAHTVAPTPTQEAVVGHFDASELYAMLDILSNRIEALENVTPTPTPTSTPVLKHSIEVTSNSVKYSPENIHIELSSGYLFDDSLIGSGMLTLVDVKHSRVVYVHLDRRDDLDISEAEFNGRNYSWAISPNDWFAKCSYVISDNYVITIYMPLDIWHGEIEKEIDTIWKAMEVILG